MADSLLPPPSAQAGTLTIRRARPADIPALNVVRVRAYRTLGAHHYSERQIDGLLAHRPVLDRQLIDDGTYFVAWLDGRIVGGGGWSFRATLLPDAYDDRVLDPRTDAARLRSFFVDPDVAGRGIGHRLVVACMVAARAAGFRRATLVSTRPGTALYTKSGFSAVRPVNVPLPNGLVLPCTVMHAAL